MIRRFVPPPIEALRPCAVPGEIDALGAMRQAGYQEGFAAGQRSGHAEGFAEAEARTRAEWAKDTTEWRIKLDELTACNTISHGLAQLLAARSADYLTLARQTREAIGAALDLLFPALMAHAIGAEVLALIEQALTDRAPEEITVRASAETIAATSAQGIPSASSMRLRLRPTPDYPPYKADISWTGGGLLYEPEILLRKVTDVLMNTTLRKDETDA